jgi:hypothetical protein
MAMNIYDIEDLEAEVMLTATNPSQVVLETLFHVNGAYAIFLQLYCTKLTCESYVILLELTREAISRR